VQELVVLLKSSCADTVLDDQYSISDVPVFTDEEKLQLQVQMRKVCFLVGKKLIAIHRHIKKTNSVLSYVVGFVRTDISGIDQTLSFHLVLISVSFILMSFTPIFILLALFVSENMLALI